MTRAKLAPRLLAWHDRHGRHDLPWQLPRTPYRVWVSEVMLQQTRVATALPYFERFLARFPDLPALAEAELDDVLAAWSGLGYYRRARNLHAAARACVERHGGELPADLDELSALPGIGRSTAGAILAQAHGQRVAILDGNVKRVLCRYHAVEGWPGRSAVERRLWELAEAHLPAQRLADYTQAIMDLGATVCTRRRAACESCPLRDGCVAHASGRVEELPESAPGKTLPRRQALLLVARDGDGRVLLQRRGPTGVWAELWSLPQVEDLESAARFAELTLGRGLHEAQALEPFDHVFSHFRLRLEPLLWHGLDPAIAAIAAIADAPAQRWETPGDAARLSLPAPIRRLIAGLDPAKPLSSPP